jgi:8-oxo-dGTP pyrophosphatase MutT (NUDIX family)
VSAAATLTNAWRKRLNERADRAPATPRIPLRLHPAGPRIGSIESAALPVMLAAQLPLTHPDDGGLALAGSPDAALAAIARWLHGRGLSSRWRDELLDVPDERDAPVAVVERAAVRPLGITTQAVHLVGRRADGRIWLQQRAADKATDPNLWDTLMGGLIAAGESVEQTLERETWEEAGLRIEALRDVAPFGRVTVRRPVREGYMVEHIHLFGAVVPDTLLPQNQDGEVQRFECLDRAALIERLHADAFTLEAALILARWIDAGAHP